MCSLSECPKNQFILILHWINKEVTPAKFGLIGHVVAKLASRFSGSVQFKFRTTFMLSDTSLRGGCYPFTRMT
jgi:hypothetical protein